MALDNFGVDRASAVASIGMCYNNSEDMVVPLLTLQWRALCGC